MSARSEATRSRRWLASTAAVLIPVFITGAAFAKPTAATSASSAPPPPAAPPSAPAASASSPKVQEAQEHYRRALELFDEGNYEAARLEFQTAYDLSPNFRLLYNLGQVSYAVKDYAGALTYFERYVAQGGAQIPPARRAEVDEQIAKLRVRVGTLRFDKLEKGIDVSIDDVPVGTTPLPDGVRVSMGKRRVTVSKSGQSSSTVVLEVSGGETREVNVTLAKERAPIVVRETDRSWIPILAWTTTALLAAGAGTTGYIAYSSAKRNEDLRGTAGADASEIDATDQRRKTFSLAADVLTVAAVVAGGLSIWLSVRGTKSPPANLAVGAAPTGANVSLSVVF